MPTVITTSTAATATAYSNQRKVDRCQNGVLWEIHAQGGDNSIYPRYSTDNGATWTAAAQVLAGGVGIEAANSSFFIDLDDYAHLVWKQNDTGGGLTFGYIYFMRGTPNAGRTAWTWSAATTVNTNTISNYPDVVAHREGTGWKAHVVFSQADGSDNAAAYDRLNITSGSVISKDTSSPYVLGSFGVANAHTYPSIDFNHTGDGKTVAGSTPHLYVAGSAGTTGAGKGIRFKKATYSAGSWTWGTEREIDSTRYVNGPYYWMNCIFDGTRVLMAGFVYDGANIDIVLHERDAGDTTTTARVLVDNAVSSLYLYGGSATYDDSGDVYLLGRNADEAAGTFDLVYRKWTRSGASLGSEVVVDSGVGDTPYVSAKRGYSNNSIEFIYTDGTASPYNVTYDSISLNVAPNAPTLVTPANASTVDLADGETFTATHSDPDGGAANAYAFRRKISGAAAYEYWNAGTSAWQSTIVWNTIAEVAHGGTVSVAFAAGKWTNGNIYNWSLATQDTLGAQGPFASDFTVTAASTPTVTVSAPSGTVTDTSYPSVEWSHTHPEGAAQETYQVKIFDQATYDEVGFDPATGVAIYNSTELSGAAQSIASTVALNNGTTFRAYVRVKVGGVYSAWNYTTWTQQLDAPTPPSLTVTPLPADYAVHLEVAGIVNGVVGGETNDAFEFIIERGVSEDGGATWAWTEVRGATLAAPLAPPVPEVPVAEVTDYEPPLNLPLKYRAVARVTV